MGRVRGGSALRLAAAVGVALSCGIQEDQLKCEEAVSHLASCCPDFDPATVNCGTVAGIKFGSCEREVYGGELSAELADCLGKASCEDLLSNGVCDVARHHQRGRQFGQDPPSDGVGPDKPARVQCR